MGKFCDWFELSTYEWCKNSKRKLIHHLYNLFFTNEIGQSSFQLFFENRECFSFGKYIKNKVNEAWKLSFTKCCLKMNSTKNCHDLLCVKEIFRFYDFTIEICKLKMIYGIISNKSNENLFENVSTIESIDEFKSSF